MDIFSSYSISTEMVTLEKGLMTPSNHFYATSFTLSFYTITLLQFTGKAEHFQTAIWFG